MRGLYIVEIAQDREEIRELDRLNRRTSARCSAQERANAASANRKAAEKRERARKAANKSKASKTTAKKIMAIAGAVGVLIVAAWLGWTSVWFSVATGEALLGAACYVLGKYVGGRR